VQELLALVLKNWLGYQPIEEKLEELTETQAKINRRFQAELDRLNARASALSKMAARLSGNDSYRAAEHESFLNQLNALRSELESFKLVGTSSYEHCTREIEAIYELLRRAKIL
jgi:hypothetical protein